MSKEIEKMTAIYEKHKNTMYAVALKILKNPQDGLSDHVGIVERVEDGIIYTIEGNSGDSCRENHYAVGHYEFLGYGVPAY